MLCGKGKVISVIIAQYLSFAADVVLEQEVGTKFETNSFAFIGLSGEGDIFLAFSY